MNYATAVILAFQSGAKEVTLKARGRAISKALDVSEVLRRRFFEGSLGIEEVSIGTDMIEDAGHSRPVSTIAIKLRKTE